MTPVRRLDKLYIRCKTSSFSRNLSRLEAALNLRRHCV